VRRIGGQDDELADQLGILPRREHRGPAAERVAEDVRSVEAEMADERGDVVGHEPDVDRTVDVRRPAVTLEIDDDRLAALGERRQDRPECLARSEPAMEQDERPTGAVRLIVKIDAVHLGVLAVPGRRVGPTRRHSHRSLLAWEPES
jgi:hypothetical protein